MHRHDAGKMREARGNMHNEARKVIRRRQEAGAKQNEARGRRNMRMLG
jgi:hypothetical protein